MLETDRLIITEALESHIYTIIEMELDKENSDFVWSGTYDEHREEIHAPDFKLFIFKKKEQPNNIVGFALCKLDFKSEIFELRRIVVTEKGVGYGKEVMMALLKYAFESCSVNRFWLDVYPDNIKGIQLYERLGLHKDGVLRQNYKSSRGYLDQIVYSMLKNEYFH